MFSHLDNPEVNPFGTLSPDEMRAYEALLEQGVEPTVPESVAQAAAMRNMRRAQWGMVHKGAVLFTAMAVKARDWGRARQGEELIAMASRRAGLDAVLLNAIFGGEIPAVDTGNRLIAACHEAGKSASAQQVAEAREVVRANQTEREASAQARREVGRAARAQKNREVQLLRAQQRAANANVAAQAAAVRAARETAEKSAYAEKKSNFEAALASGGVREAIARWNGFDGLTADVEAAAEQVASAFRAAGMSVNMISAAKGIWGKLKIHAGSSGLTIFTDDSREEPASVRRARIVSEHLAAGAIEVDGVILTVDGQEIDIENGLVDAGPPLTRQADN